MQMCTKICYIFCLNALIANFFAKIKIKTLHKYEYWANFSGNIFIKSLSCVKSTSAFVPLKITPVRTYLYQGRVFCLGAFLINILSHIKLLRSLFSHHNWWSSIQWPRLPSKSTILWWVLWAYHIRFRNWKLLTFQFELAYSIALLVGAYPYSPMGIYGFILHSPMGLYNSWCIPLWGSTYGFVFPYGVLQPILGIPLLDFVYYLT